MFTRESTEKYTSRELANVDKITDEAILRHGFKVETHNSSDIDYLRILKDDNTEIGSVIFHPTTGTSLEGHPEKVAERIVPFSGTGNNTPEERQALYIKNHALLREITDGLQFPTFEERLETLTDETWEIFKDSIKDKYLDGTLNDDYLDEISKNKGFGIIKYDYDLEQFLREVGDADISDEDLFKGVNPWSEQGKTPKSEARYAHDTIEEYVRNALDRKIEESKLDWEKSQPKGPGM